jgi:hypothetical protein
MIIHWIILRGVTIFGKGQKANLSKAERNELGKLVKILEDYWLGE